MLTNPPMVVVYVFPSVINLGRMNAWQLEQQAETIAANLQTLSPLISFPVNLRLFEYYNAKFSEKQVRRIDQNFFDYSRGTRFRLNVPFQNPPRRLRYLIQKFFSGDVSGDIDEALFAYFLIEEMNLNSSYIGHTRPDKRGGYLTTDFVIWDISFKLASILQRNRYALPLLAEVKAFTGQIDPVRISHGLAQLKILISNSSLLGLLFLAIRNEQRQRYDSYLVRVER